MLSAKEMVSVYKEEGIKDNCELMQSSSEVSDTEVKAKLVSSKITEEVKSEEVNVENVAEKNFAQLKIDIHRLEPHFFLNKVRIMTIDNCLFQSSSFHFSIILFSNI